MNPDTARPTREPETEAGRALLRPEFDAYGLRGMVLAIEAELRRSLAAKVRTLPWNVAGQATAPIGGCDEEWAVGEYQSAVLALIEGTDPASPEPWDRPRLVFHASCGCFEQEGGSVGLCDWHRRRNMLDREPRSLSEPLTRIADGLARIAAVLENRVWPR